MSSNLWNADGSARKPQPGQGEEVRAFADLVAQEPAAGEESFMSYARLQQEAKAATPAGVGDIVHYWDGDACVAAMVTEAGMFEGEGDYLAIFQPRQQPGCTAIAIAHDEDKGRDTWHWPESL